MATILVVDDEAGIRSFLREALELFGHTAHTASDGAEAWAMMHRFQYDALLTDLTMPGVNGMDLLRAVRERQPDVVTLVLTAHGTVSTAVEAMKLGAYDYVEKPLGELRELRALFERALAHRSVTSGPLASEADLVDDGTPLHFGDPVMASVADAIRRVAPTQATVLLQGESGVGKDVVARLIHRNSTRSQGPFVAINSASLSETLLESELFGHEKGAFTGANERRRGKIEAASGGTFFLDEVGELRPDAQARLLRVLETRTFERVGGTAALSADVRWIAATHRDLRRMVEQGLFRADLYHRLAIFPVRVPPLRERRTDLLPLAHRLLAQACSALGVPPLGLSTAAESWLLANPWPGNIRELRNALERAAILAAPHSVEVRHLGDTDDAPDFGTAAASGERTGSLETMEREAIRRALAECSGNRRLAAERLGIGLRTLYDKLRRYQLESLR